jgi:glycosyltransferase involved in cell wall biosynthesis/protein-tyrosine-phosphatase
MLPLTTPWPRTFSSVDTCREIRVCHVMSADLWAGAEVQVGTVASFLVQRPEVKLCVVLFNEGRLARELRTLGLEVEVIDERQHTALGLLVALTRFLSSHRVDIVHTHRYKDTVLGSIAAKLTRVPVVIRTVHGLPEPMRGWDLLKFQMYQALDRIALSCFADRIIAVSKGIADSLTAAGYRRSAVIPVHNGIDLAKVQVARDRDTVRRELGIAPGVLTIGTAGRLSPVKAQGDLIRAARRIIEKAADTRFVIVGDGPLRDALTTTAAQLGVDSACCFVGSRPDILDLVGAMDIFVLPSLHEGIPMALLEAMALGKPVVATAVGGVPEVLTDRVNGLLVPPRDDAALADACLALAADRPWAQSLGATARRTVAERFSHDLSGETLLDTYRSVVRPRPVPERTSGGDFSAPALAWELVRGLVQIVRRRTTDALEVRRERWRMNQIRRRPDQLAATLATAKGILVACHGNIIRSPFAARLMSRCLSTRPGVRIASAGLGAVAGNPPHPTALQLAATRAVDLTDHTASPVETKIVAASDVIFVMDIRQLITMGKRFPEARSKTFLLTCLASDVPLEVADPVDGDEQCFQKCFEHVTRAVHPIVEALCARTLPR